MNETKKWYQSTSLWGGVVAMIEKVASSPQMGVCSAFTFGCGYGEILGILAALRIPYKTVAPGVCPKATRTSPKPRRSDFIRHSKSHTPTLTLS